MPIAYVTNARPEAAEVCALAVAVGWRDPARHGIDAVQRVWDLAPCTVLARDGEKLVGMCRASWDGAIMAEVKNVVVHPDYQRQGIGTELVRLLLEGLERLQVSHVTLITGPGQEAFYERFGFEVRHGTAMVKSRGLPDHQEDDKCCMRS